MEISFLNTSLGNYFLLVLQFKYTSLKSQYYHPCSTLQVTFVFLSLGYMPQNDYFQLQPFTCKINFLTAQFHCLYELNFHCLCIRYRASSLFSFPEYNEPSNKEHEQTWDSVLG